MRFNDQRGFTVAEVLVAAVIVSLAFVALATIVPVATSAVQEGHQLSTATFLADQKMEQIRSLPWNPTSLTTSYDCLGVSVSSTDAPTVPVASSSSSGTCTYGPTTVASGGTLPWLADESSTSITNFNGYSRQVRVTDCGASTCFTGISDPGMRFVTVTVRYTPPSVTGTASTGPKSYSVSMIISQK